MRLLIVDDDMPTVEAIRQAIDWGSIEINAVDIAYSAAQARRVLRRGQTDIVISDIEMPKGTGLDLLSWVREQALDVEFLFLTCHERFDYAKSALKLNAAEYLNKPFNAQVMALSLQKTIEKIKETRRLRDNNRYGAWRQENPRQEERNFWLSLFSGTAPRDRAQLRKEIEARQLPIDAELSYRLTVTRVMEYELQAAELGQNLLFYMLENLHGRLLCGAEESGRVVRHYDSSGLWFYTAVTDEPDARIKERCGKLILACGDALHVKLTCCIGNAVPVEALESKPAELQTLIERGVAFYGQAFTQSEIVLSAEMETQVLDLGKLHTLLLEHDKVQLLNAVKGALSSRTATKTLSERILYLIQQELLQAMYAHLSEVGVQAAKLFSDEDSVRFLDQACRSSVDMLRWANYLLERAFSAEDDLHQAGTLVNRIETYIREHYQEDIGRNEIAAEFHLSPEYLAKLYKRKTGQSLKTAIWEQRMEQAKLLLRNPEVRIGDVAVAVGIDNISYFTTVFKQRAGVTPLEFQRDIEESQP